MEQPNWDQLTEYNEIPEKFPFNQRPKTKEEIEAEELKQEQNEQGSGLQNAA